MPSRISRPRLIVLVAATAASLVAVAGADGQEGLEQSARLTLVRMQPLVVAGAGFARGERVRVTATSTTGIRKTAVRVASRSGTFRAALGALRLGRCEGFTVRAVGARGTTATAKRPPLPACITQRAP